MKQKNIPRKLNLESKYIEPNYYLILGILKKNTKGCKNNFKVLHLLFKITLNKMAGSHKYIKGHSSVKTSQIKLAC